MSEPAFKDLEALLRKGERFAPGSPMEIAMRATRNLLMNEARLVLDKGGSIAIQCKNGVIVRYVWDKQTRGWQATI